MIIRNKKNGTNTLAYKAGATIEKVIIPSGAIVQIPGLKDISQVVNKADFQRGWFEEVKSVQEVGLEKNMSFKKAKEEAEEYSEEEKKEKKNKKQ